MNKARQLKVDKYMMDVADLTAGLSYCRRLNVGAVIARDGRPLVTGYNGTIAGTDNCCEEPTGDIDNPLKTSDFVIHAEQNAIFYAARNGLNTEGTSIYITHAPCPNCAKAIASAGIKRVVYKEVYRDSRGIQFLKDCNVEVELLN